MLRGNRTVELRVIAPGAGNVAEVALWAPSTCNSSTSRQGFNRNFVQAFTLLASSPAESLVQGIRHIADRILHAFIVGNAGIICKQKAAG